MSREYLNIRLSYEAKYWIEKLQEYKQQKLDKYINDGLIADIENEVIENHSKILDGVSLTIILKVSTSSIVEVAFNKTKHYALEKWRQIIEKLEKPNNEIDYQKEIGTLTPRLYLDTNIIQGLEQYRIDFKSQKNIRSLKMSFIIKCVVYAYYLEVFNNQQP
ncbi:hypothetical protein [Bacillus vallismortis]|uniref:hypothetical protein n=1 Tax=Bacillus vallismortis TaxID=72361 RepID=UPI002090C318|nr:hypothetical protein [Bacillus vallismortis]MCO4851780.1 hypothetical protein [Bacillus vallismortis]